MAFPVYPDGGIVFDERLPTIDDCDLNLIPITPFDVPYTQEGYFITWLNPLAVSPAFYYNGNVYQCFAQARYQVVAWGDLAHSPEESGFLPTLPLFQVVTSGSPSWHLYDNWVGERDPKGDMPISKILEPYSSIEFQTPLYNVPVDMWTCNNFLNESYEFNAVTAWKLGWGVDVLFRIPVIPSIMPLFSLFLMGSTMLGSIGMRRTP